MSIFKISLVTLVWKIFYQEDAKKIYFLIRDIGILLLCILLFISKNIFRTHPEPNMTHPEV